MNLERRIRDAFSVCYIISVPRTVCVYVRECVLACMCIWTRARARVCAVQCAVFAYICM